MRRSIHSIVFDCYCSLFYLSDVSVAICQREDGNQGQGPCEKIPSIAKAFDASLYCFVYTLLFTLQRSIMCIVRVGPIGTFDVGKLIRLISFLISYFILVSFLVRYYLLGCF